MNVFDAIIHRMSEVICGGHYLVRLEMEDKSLPSPIGYKVKLGNSPLSNGTFDHELCLMHVNWDLRGVEYEQYDLSDPADLDRFFERLANTFGR